jgi:hypothetical protein
VAGNFLVILAVILMMVVWVKYNIRLAFANYMIFSLTVPNLHILNLILPFELIAFPIISVLYFLTPIFKNMSIFNFIFRLPYIFVTLFFFLLLVSTIISLLFGIGSFIGFATLFGVVRYFLLIIFSYSLLDKKHMDFILVTVLSINTFLVIYQVIVPTSIDLFYNFYFKDSLVPLATYKEIGSFVRCTGSFGSPIYLGSLSLICFSWFLGLSLKDGNLSKKNIICIFMSLACGLFAVSKLSFFGIPLILTLYLFYIIKKFLRFDMVLKFEKCLLFIFLLVTILPLFYFLIHYSLSKYGDLLRYLSYLDNPLQIFASRYSEDQASLIKTLDVFKKYYVIGVGLTLHKNEFLGDSMYIALLHNTGVLGAFFMFFLFLSLLTKFHKLKNYPYFFILISFLMSGLAYGIYSSLLGSIILACSLKEFTRSYS